MNNINMDPEAINGKSTQTVRVVLGLWHYRKTFDLTLKLENYVGFEVFEAALEEIYDLCYDSDSDLATVTLVSEDGGELSCDDDCEDGVDWIKEMVVSIEILSVEV